MFVYNLGRVLYEAGISIFTYNIKLNVKVKEPLDKKNDGWCHLLGHKTNV